MNFMSMEYFATLARERSFTRAAERLHITQQTLSAHIAALEKETGCQLFVRHVPLELTYGGEVFFRYALHFRKQLEDLKRELDDVNHHEAGRLTIGVPATRGRTLLPEVIDAYEKKYPKMSVHLSETSTVELRKKLIEGDVDLVITHFPAKLPGIKTVFYYTDEEVLLISKKLMRRIYREEAEFVARRMQAGETDDFAPLKDCPFLLHNRNTIAGHAAWNFFHKTKIRPIIKVEAENAQTLMDLCLLGAGAFFCSKGDFTEKILSREQRQELYVFRLPHETYDISFGYMEDSYQWSMISRFIELAKGMRQEQEIKNQPLYGD